MEKEKIVAAVKELRSELDLGQAEFGRLLPGEKSISTVQRYEKDVPPIPVLLVMMEIAEAKNLTGIAGTLRCAVKEQVDEELPGLEDFLMVYAADQPRTSAADTLEIPKKLRSFALGIVAFMMELDEENLPPRQILINETLRQTLQGISDAATVRKGKKKK